VKVLLILIPFVLLGIAVASIAFRGGPAAVRDAAARSTGRGRSRAFRITIVAIYLVAGIGIPAAVIAGRNEAEGGVGPLEQKSPSAQAEEGKRIFKETCASCHTLAAVNAHGVTGPDLDEIGQVTKSRVLNAIRVGGTGQKRMPSGLLQGQDAQDVATFVSQVAGR
jgi:mono/diheme cytochrome c family protein